MYTEGDHLQSPTASLEIVVGPGRLVLHSIHLSEAAPSAQHVHHAILLAAVARDDLRRCRAKLHQVTRMEKLSPQEVTQ